jgi:hypothetical protein
VRTPIHDSPNAQEWLCLEADQFDPARSGSGGLREAFDGAFRAVDSSAQARSAQAWTQRYRANPLGSPAIVAVAPPAWEAVAGAVESKAAWISTGTSADGSRVLAHWGALAIPARAESEDLTLGHVVDTFASIDLGRTRRARVFEAVCQAFIDRYCGSRSPRFPLCFGLPVRPAWRLGRALLGYEVLQSVWRLERDSDHRASTLPAGLRLEEPERFDERDSALFERVASERPVTTMRPAGWLAWRFDPLQSPGARLWRIWRGDELAAWCAFRVTEFEGERVGLILERVVPADDAEARAALDGECLRAAADAGVARVVFVCAEPSPELARMQRRGWVARPSRTPLVGRSFGRSRDASFWGRNLVWTLADTDLA